MNEVSNTNLISDNAFVIINSRQHIESIELYEQDAIRIH